MLTNEDKAIVQAANGKTWKIDSDVVAFLFSVHQWGNRRVADKRQIETAGTDKTLLHLSKQLIESAEYKAIGRYMYETKAWVIARSVPSFFREGCYLFRLSMVETVEAELSFRRTMLSGLIASLIDVYPEQIERAREQLGGQFKASDYPSIEELRASFRWDSQWICFDVPEGLPESVYAAEKSKAQNMWNDAAESITFALREAFKGLIAHAIDKLQVGADGKVKIFRDTTLTNITDFIAAFKDRNITADSELETMIRQADNILASVDTAKVLRDSTMVRDMVRTGFQTIEKQIDSLLIDKPIRKFNLDD